MVKSTKPNFRVKHPYGYLIQSILLGLVMLCSAIFSVVSYNFFTRVNKSNPEIEVEASTTLPEWDKDWIDTTLTDTIYLATYSSSVLDETTNSDYIMYYNGGYTYSYINEGEHNIDTNGLEYFSSKNNYADTAYKYSVVVNLQDINNNMSAGWVYIAMPWNLELDLSFENDGEQNNLSVAYFTNLNDEFDISGKRGVTLNPTANTIDITSIASEDRLDENFCYIAIYVQAYSSDESLIFSAVTSEENSEYYYNVRRYYGQDVPMSIMPTYYDEANSNKIVGNGSAETPYVISNLSELVFIQSAINSMGKAYAGIVAPYTYYSLDGDITVSQGVTNNFTTFSAVTGKYSEVEISNYSSVAKDFSGVLLGNAHKITYSVAGIPVFNSVNFDYATGTMPSIIKDLRFVLDCNTMAGPTLALKLDGAIVDNVHIASTKDLVTLSDGANYYHSDGYNYGVIAGYVNHFGNPK